MRAADLAWALAAVLPLSAIGLLAGAALQRAGVSATTRERVFSLVFWIGPAACLLALAAHALPRPATAEITVILRATPLGALPQASRILAEARALPRLPEFLLALAAVGAALRLIQLARAWLALHALRRQAQDAPAETVRAVRAAGLKPSVPLKLSAGASSPIAAGLLRPEILLPERFAAPEAAALVCRHEAQHIARRDNLRLALEQLAGALLWFDPLRAAVHRRLLAAREERCDDAALAGSSLAERTLYARTLLEELSQPPSPILAVGLIGAGKSCAAARVSAILDPRPAPRRPALTFALCGLLAAAGTSAALAAGQSDQPAPDWVGKVVSAVASVRPVRPIAAEAASAPLRVRPRPTHARPTPIIDTDFTPLSEVSGGPVDGSDLTDDMVVYVNGDMDVDDLNHLVFQLAASRGIQATADNRPLLVQAVLRNAADEPRVEVMADVAQRFDGRDRYVGNVEIVGDLKRAFDGAVILVDGLQAPASLVITSKLIADTVEFKRASGGLSTGKFLSVNIHGVRLAQ